MEEFYYLSEYLNYLNIHIMYEPDEYDNFGDHSITTFG